MLTYLSLNILFTERLGENSCIIAKYSVKCYAFVALREIQYLSVQNTLNEQALKECKIFIRQLNFEKS